MYSYNKSSMKQMNHTHFNLIGGEKKGIIILVTLATLLFFINGSYPPNSTIELFGEQSLDPISDLIINELKMAVNEPNGKALVVSQYANFTESYTDPSLPSNVSFTLQKDWVAQSINISFEGVSQKKDRVINGTFDSIYHGWIYYTNLPGDYIGQEGQAPGNPGGSVEIYIDDKNSYLEGDYGYYEQNITIQEELSFGKLSVLSFDYYLDDNPENFSAYLAIIIGNSEKNRTRDFSTQLQVGSWQSLTMTYDTEEFHEPFLPGENVTVRVGVYSHGEKRIVGGTETFFQIDNVKFDLWTMPNQMNIVGVKDLEFNSNKTYINTTYGKGYYYNATERSYPTNKEIIFTISQNVTGINDFYIENININVNLLKRINSSISGLDGSLYTTGIPMIWQTELVITIPSDYKNTIDEITKPADWNITQILDGYDVNRIQSCTGTDPGSIEFIIPNGVFDQALWKIEAISSNYILNASLVVWNGSAFNEESSITLGDTFQINATLNDTIPFANTQANCTIEYPNGTIFWQKSKILGSYNINFGNFTVGPNMSVGNYQTIIEWTNNQSQSDRDKVGFLQVEFDVSHQTNLTAVSPEEVKVSGEPYLMKVEFKDYNLNQSIDFATITYNSTYGASGTMAYLGSGIYVADVDLSGLSAGDYFFSFNASKIYYINQSITNLIHLEIITQPLALEIPPTVINVDANSYAISRINVTGALSGTLLPGSVNVTTDWHEVFTVTDYLNGTVKLNLSTRYVPTQGIPETFTITVFANKTDYGTTFGFISITVHPIPTIVNVNETIVDVYINRSFYLSVNYTEEGSEDVITGATLNVSWVSFYSIMPVANGFIVNFSTIDLSLATHTILLQLNHPGYETGFQNVYVNVLPKTTYLEIFLNQEDKTSDKSLAIPGNEPINITILYKDNITDSFISGATVELFELGSGISETLTENGQQYSIIFNPGDLPVDIYFFSITAQKENYNIVPSSIKITIDQIEILVETPGVNGTRELYIGETLSISIILTEEGSGKLIENANASYSWLSYLNEEITNMGDGIYETQIKIPESAHGPYTIELIIKVEGSQFKNRKFPISIYVSKPAAPNYLFLIVLGVSIPVISVLGVLSLRSYVIIPRKRKKDRLFMNTIQVFKDVKNIQAVMFIQRLSGLPFFTKNYTNFDQKNNSLLSGFIQAITIFGEQMINGSISDDQKKKGKEIYSKNIIELNFKYFHLLICDYQSVRSLLILREHSSERLKKQFYWLSIEIDAKLGNKIVNFTGDVSVFESKISTILDEFLFLHYNEPYKLIDDASYMKFLKKGGELQAIESRILNVIISLTKISKEFTINRIIEEIDEKEIDKIYGGLHTLIQRNIIISASQEGDDAHPLLSGLKK